MIAADTNVPDLLRRFVSTPHCATVVAGDAEIAVETNDPALLTAISQAAITESRNQPGRTLRLKVVRDPDAPCGGIPVTLMKAEPLVTLLAGTGTVLSLDCARGEILGFLAPDVSAERFAREMLPVLLEEFGGISFLHGET